MDNEQRPTTKQDRIINAMLDIHLIAQVDQFTAFFTKHEQDITELHPMAYDYYACFEDSEFEIIYTGDFTCVVSWEHYQAFQASQDLEALKENAKLYYQHADPKIETLCHDLKLELKDYPINVKEYYQVSKWLFLHLDDLDECVFQCLDFFIWGRTATNEAICDDEIMEQVASNAEILEGQTDFDLYEDRI